MEEKAGVLGQAVPDEVTAIDLREKVKAALEFFKTNLIAKPKGSLVEHVTVLEEAAGMVGRCASCNGEGVTRHGTPVNGGGYRLRQRVNGKTVYEYKCVCDNGLTLKGTCGSCAAEFDLLAFRNTLYCPTCRVKIEGQLALVPLPKDAELKLKHEEDKLATNEANTKATVDGALDRLRKANQGKQQSDIKRAKK